MTDQRLLLKEKLANISLDQIQQPVMVGLDGFVDYIIDVVKTRHTVNDYTPMTGMAQMGHMITEMAGKSCNIEFVMRQSKLGGNGPIMANALATIGARVTYVGALGLPIDAVFNEFAEQCAAVYSIAGPGYTDALEFEDGKIMLGKHYNLWEVTWDNLIKIVGKDILHHQLTTSSLVAMTNWTMLPFMTEIWQGIQKEILKGCSHLDRWLFVDLADPAKRMPESIMTALETISKFSEWYHVILGLNESEGLQIAKVLGGTDLGADEDLCTIARYIFDRIKVAHLVIHPTKYAVAADKENTYRVDGPYCAKPVLTTGAGDNFNAGFCLGKLLGLDNELALLCAVASSGFYVRNGRSATLSDYQDLLSQWSACTLS